MSSNFNCSYMARSSSIYIRFFFVKFFFQPIYTISSPLFSIFSLVAILVGSRDHRTQIWKGVIQGPFHQSLVQIGPVASEELIKMWKAKPNLFETIWSIGIKLKMSAQKVLGRLHYECSLDDRLQILSFFELLSPLN
jgi:hypothetical protein